MKYTIAFAGNPNVGKSAWINALSNADFKVGNWPGVTVEKKEAFTHWGNDDYYIVDLPGTHSLQESGNEENITASYLRNEHVDLIVNVLDASNLANNFLLTLCLRELQIPMLMIFNFMDEVEKYHIMINTQKISRRLQIDILAYSAFDQKHYEDVKQAIMEHCGKPVFYYPLLSKEEESIYVELYNKIDQYLHETIAEEQLHRIVMGYLQGDKICYQQLRAWSLDMAVLDDIRKTITVETLLEHRYLVIENLMTYVKEDQDLRYAKSRKIDAVLLHKYWGMPIFFIIFAFLLLFVFQASAPWNDYISYLINDVATRYIGSALSFSPRILRDFVLNGIVAGVGGVLVFVPVMAFLYFMLSLLEESGYMARISFLLDRAMRTFHLSGKSFVSLLLGFGCNVPAIYAARTLDNEKQKRLTAILIPFMSCGARLPVYVLFASAFFPHQAALMILCVYGMGIFVALLFALIFSRTSYMSDDSMYVQELPPYHRPSLRVVLHKVKEEIQGYVKKATGIVLWAMMILWALSYFPSGDIQTSYIAQASKAIQPLFEPLGFGTRWESIASLPGGIIAKETIVGYYEQVLTDDTEKQHYDIDPADDIKQIAKKGVQAIQDSVHSIVRPQIHLQKASSKQVINIKSLWNDEFAKLRAFCFMVYVLLSVPCIMSLQALYHEYGIRLLMTSIAVMLIVPYVCAFSIFQIFSHLL